MDGSTQQIESSSGLPPGPAWPRDEQTLRWAARPAQLLTHCQQTFGSVFTLRFRDWGDHVVLCRAGLVRPVLAGDPRTFLAGEGNGPLRPLLGDRSLLLLDGDEHAAERSGLLPAFRPRSLGFSAKKIDAYVEAVTASWRDGEQVPLTQALLDISRRVILGRVLGSAAEALDTELGRVISSLLEAAPVAASLPRDPAALDAAGMVSRARIEALRGSLRRWLADQRARLSRDDGLVAEWLRDEQPEPTLEHLGDRVLTLILAGHETTATALSWTLAEAHADASTASELRRRLHDDAYLDAVNQESLRLHPPIPVISRRLACAVKLGGWTLPSGVFVTPCVWLVHRDADVFPEPERFDPKRFLEGKTYRPHEYLPFGGGARRCIGMHFAMSEMRHVLRSLLDRFELEPITQGPPATVRRSVTLAPAAGGAMRVRRVTK
jgi:cytochrome P450